MGLVCGALQGFAQPHTVPMAALLDNLNLIYHVTMICFWGALTTSHCSLLLI
jgi:hypothetical protein